jgi:hypothetical protein
MEPDVTVVVTCRRFNVAGFYWDIDVEIDGENMGGGTTPDFPLSLASDILYGDTSDWLNGSEGLLDDYLVSNGLPTRNEAKT